MKAKFICAIKPKYIYQNTWEHTDLVYEYRGIQYIVTKHNNGCENNLKEQHEEEQKRIDKKLDNPEEVKEYTGECEKALDMLYEYFEGDGE